MNKNQMKNQLKTDGRRQSPTLRLTPTAWAKLLFLRDAGETEIGGFGIAAKDDLLLIEDVVLVEQTCTAVHVELDDVAVADFFDEQVDSGRWPEEFGRVWIHTHPGASAQPSRTDDETFERVFGGTEWAVMFILAGGGQTYARLRYHQGPGVEVLLPVEVDYSRPFAGSDQDQWQAEYDRCVREEFYIASPNQKLSQLQVAAGSGTEEDSSSDEWAASGLSVDDWYDAWLDYTDPSEFIQEVADGCYPDF